MNKKVLKLFILLITIFSFKNIYAETINTHSTMSHTKQEIIEKYISSKSKFNYNNSVYKELPIAYIPYKEGSLNSEVETDVLNHLNFYRFLQGLNEITINTSRQSANQKGALIMAANGYLSHKPSKPDGMDDNFYNIGYEACGSKSNTFQGNISMGIRIDKTPEAFITDNTNVEANVAHRSSLLNPNAKQVSFGYVNGFSAMSIYYDNTNSNKDSYYAWPPAGYFPIEAMEQDSNTRWSVYLGNYSLTSTTKVTLTYNNKEYVVNRSNINFTSYSKNMYYNLPNELRGLITNNDRFIPGTIVNVKIENLFKSNVGYTINYDIKFFTISEIKVEKIDLDKKNISLQVGEEENIIPTFTPTNATDKNLNWISSNNNIATVKDGRVTGVGVGEATITATSDNGTTASTKVTVTSATPGVLYTTHVQYIGWQKYVKDGVMAGTSGQSLRLEGIKIKLKGMPYSGNIEYKTHIQNIGWEKYFKKNDDMSGTSGQSLRLEGIRIRLTGDVSNHYDVYYRVHAQQFGWLGWAKNGEDAGTAGYAYRLEGIEIKLVAKGTTFPEYGKSMAFKSMNNIIEKEPTKVTYTTHVQYVGWQDYVYDGEMAGTSGQSLRLEGIKIKLEDQEYTGNIEYRTHIQNIGWEKEYKKNDTMSGTSGKSLRLEAIEIKLTGEISKHFDIYYRVHAQQFGWLGWAKNGEDAGTAGYAYRLEGINIELMPKGENFSEYGKTVPFKEKK